MTTSCKAVIFRGTGAFILDTIDVDDPTGDEVLVQIRAAGVCHTEWDSLSWGKLVVMGHEAVGIVVKVGDAVKNLAPGDAVVLN